MGEKETATDIGEKKSGFTGPRPQESTASLPSARVVEGQTGDGSAEAKINNTKSNIKNLAGEGGGSVGAGGGEQAIAVSDPGMPAEKPKTASA